MRKQLLIILPLLLAAAGSMAQVTSDNGTFAAESGTDLQLTTNGITRLSILSASGNVGIGVTPTDKFQVGGNIIADGNVKGSQFFSTSGNYNSTADLSFKTNGTSRLSVLSANGFVGIGITPSEMLHVNGNILSSQITTTSGVFNSNGNLSFTTSGTNRLSVLSTNGYVGIGIAAPTQKLHISGGNLLIDNGASPTIFTGTGSSELSRYLQLVNSADRATASGLKAGGVLIADTYTYADPGKNDLIVKGKVAIGTPLATNPNSYTLAVNGTIGAKDMRIEKTSATWPDYVFANNYSLPSLAEVEAYIAKNNHLQDVPSAKDIEKNGHSVGEMDAILLKKVEELTLYIIEQQKEIEALKKRLDSK